MELRDLQQLVTIAEAGSLVRAAERLGVTQPTLSKGVTRLERAFGIKLIERLARGVRLTPTGRVVVARLRGIDVGIRDMMAEVRDIRQGKAGVITFGVGTGIPPAFIATACKPLLAGDGIRIVVVGARADTLVRSVRAGDIEFAVTVAPAQKSGLVWHSLFADPMVPVAHKGHALAGISKMTWNDLAAARWIMPVEGTITRHWFESQFRERNLTPPLPIVSLDSVAGWAGLGSVLDLVALLPASSLKYLPVASLGVMLRTPEDWHSDRVVGIVNRREGYLSAAGQRLIDRLIATSQPLASAAATKSISDV